MSPHFVEMAKKKNWIMGDKFEGRMPHHQGIKALWETKWKFPCTKSVYPFHDGKYEDFAPVFEYLIESDINDCYGDAYTEAFFATAETLTKKGNEAEAAGELTASSAFYLRAACVYRISRFPYITSFPEVNSGTKWKAWQAQKEVYMRAATKWEELVEEVMIPHIAAKGADRDTIPVFVRIPKAAKGTSQKVPIVLLMTGLDGYRPDNTERSREFLARGWACVIVEIPGTADCPSDPSDPESPDRLWTSILDWMECEGSFNMNQVMVWGLSSGGYCAVRIAHTHKERVKGSVAQGAGTHYFFDRNWIEKADGHEYPFSYALMFHMAARAR